MTVAASTSKASALGTRDSELGTLLIQTAHLGDVVLTLPLLLRLAERDGPVDLVTTPSAASIAYGHPAVRSVIPFDKHGADRGLAGLLRFGRRLRANRYTRAVLPHESLRSASLAWLSGAAERIGFAGAPGAFSYTRRIPRPTTGHMSTRLLALADRRDLPPRPWLALSSAERAGAAAWLATEGIAEPYVVLAPGSRWGTKRWPYFAELAGSLQHSTVVIGGPEDAALATTLVRAAPERCRSAVGFADLRSSAALIERAALVVSNDSVALHLATALDRPVVAIFGPTIPAFGFGPLGNDPVLELALPCRPCSPHGPASCPLGHHRCMREIDVARVREAVEHRLAVSA